MAAKSDMHKKMRNRNLAMLFGLLAFAVLMAIVTYVKMSGAS